MAEAKDWSEIVDKSVAAIDKIIGIELISILLTFGSFKIKDPLVPVRLLF